MSIKDWVKFWIGVAIELAKYLVKGDDEEPIPEPPEPEPPEPPTPEPPPEPDPPTTGMQPSDYLRLSVGASIINRVRVDSRSDIFVGTWTSVRNLNYAVSKCGDVIEENFGMSPEEMLAIAREGDELLNRFEKHWREALSTENWRVEKDLRFKGRSNARKEYWHPFEDRLRAQRAEISKISAIAQAHPYRSECDYDNIAGWCLCHWRGPL